MHFGGHLQRISREGSRVLPPPFAVSLSPVFYVIVAVPRRRKERLARSVCSQVRSPECYISWRDSSVNIVTSTSCTTQEWVLASSNRKFGCLLQSPDRIFSSIEWVLRSFCSRSVKLISHHELGNDFIFILVFIKLYWKFLFAEPHSTAMTRPTG